MYCDAPNDNLSHRPIPFVSWRLLHLFESLQAVYHVAKHGVSV